MMMIKWARLFVLCAVMLHSGVVLAESEAGIEQLVERARENGPETTPFEEVKVQAEKGERMGSSENGAINEQAKDKEHEALMAHFVREYEQEMYQKKQEVEAWMMQKKIEVENWYYPEWYKKCWENVTWYGSAALLVLAISYAVNRHSK